MTIQDLRTTIESSLPAWTILVSIVVGTLLTFIAWRSGRAK